MSRSKQTRKRVGSKRASKRRAIKRTARTARKGNMNSIKQFYKSMFNKFKGGCGDCTQKGG